MPQFICTICKYTEIVMTRHHTKAVWCSKTEKYLNWVSMPKKCEHFKSVYGGDK